MTAVLTSLEAAMDAFKPQIVESYSRHIAFMFGKMVEKHGPTLRGIYNCWSYAKSFRNIVAAHLTQDRATHVYSIDPERLAALAASYADDVAASWVGKINAKLGELERGTVHALDGCGFRLSGERGGRKVQIEQHMIVNVSSQGTLFNQFPARIYVDGKFTSEAAYKKMFSPAKAA